MKILFLNQNLTKKQRLGVLFLALIVILIQILMFFVHFEKKSSFSAEEFASFEKKIDSFKTISEEKIKIYPFNPNFLSDYKAYNLGLSDEEFKKLEHFRAEGKFINSAEDFQKITRISDSLLKEISPYFKFPKWNNQKKNNHFEENSTQKQPNSAKKIIKLDLNLATKEDFIKINGIGEKLSQNIINYRTKIQGFSFESQLNEVFGLKEDVILKILQEFEIKSPPNIEKININQASYYELSQIVYLKKEGALKIITYRTNVLKIKHLDELLSLEGFDEEKLKFLKLYLFCE